jgi:hypothetical protein
VLKRIHVNKHNILANRKDGENRPVFTVKTYKTNTYGHEIFIEGPSKLIYRPHRPLSCGAVAWIETNTLVFVDGVSVE